jgi:drug/metabolite transporter (DMT)-like permease
VDRAALGPLLAAALWGGMYVVSKWGFSVVPPLTLGLFRVALGGVALYALLSVSNEDTIERGDYGKVAVLGLWVSTTIATQFIGTELTNASQGSLLTILTPVFTVALGAVVLGEHVGRRKTVGIALAVVGTILVVAGQYEVTAMVAGADSAAALGVLLLIVGSVGWAGYTVWGVPVIRKYSGLTAATYSCLAAIPMLAPLAAVELYLEQPPIAELVAPRALFVVLYLGLGATTAAWVLWYRGLETLPAGTVAVFFFAQPVVGAALGAVFLGERIGPWFAVGGGVMAVGVWIVSTARA